MPYGKVVLRQLKNVYLCLALCVVASVVWIHLSDVVAVKKHLLTLSRSLIGVCIGLVVFSYVCRSIRWLGYIRRLVGVASIKSHVMIYLSGFAFTTSPGKVGELMRGSYLYEIGVPFRYTFFCFVSERILDVIIVLFLGSYFLVKHFSVSFSFLSIGIMFLPYVVASLVKRLIVNKTDKTLLEPYRALSSLWRARVLFESQVLTLLAWSVQGSILYLVLIEFGAEVSAVTAVSIYCLSLLIGAVSLIPSGVGFTELGMVWFLCLVGVDKELALAASLITRLVTLLPAISIGLVCALALRNIDKNQQLNPVQ